jgi:hypothetical protein
VLDLRDNGAFEAILQPDKDNTYQNRDMPVMRTTPSHIKVPPSRIIYILHPAWTSLATFLCLCETLGLHKNKKLIFFLPASGINKSFLVIQEVSV